MRRLALLGAAVAAAFGLTAQPCEARLTRLAIKERVPAAATGAAGSYWIVRGMFEGELDPRDPKDAIITDLALAPRNARGNVGYSATFALAYPADPARESGVILYNAPNRGSMKLAADPDGNFVLISGWQGDVGADANLQTATVPIAQRTNGKPVTGKAFVRFVDMPAGATTLPLLVGLDRNVPAPQPLSLNDPRARLFRQSADGAPLQTIARKDWAFADCARVPFPGQPDQNNICLRSGFDPAFSYGLSYTAKNPAVLGVGFAATRDLISFLRRKERDEFGAPNPIAGRARWTIATGVSQAGNYLRSFVHLGFNADMSGQIVFDGVHTDIAARLIPLNVRFGSPSGAADTFELGSEGVLWWGRYNDRIRHLGTRSLLDRCTLSSTCPKIVETVGSSEFWGLRLSPDFVGTDAHADIPLPVNVRRYYFPGVTHGGGDGGFDSSWNGRNPYVSCLLPDNPNPSSQTVRALRAALIDWVVKGAAPPLSEYPRLSHGELVRPDAVSMGYPAIPGAPSPDGLINTFADQFVGSGFRYADLSGIAALQPPRAGRQLPSLVPRVDRDGNEIGGVASVQHRVPLGTYLGWNVAADGFYKAKRCSFVGGFIPFAATRAERLARGDPRLSLEERYGSRAGFLARVRAAVTDLERERFLLPEDAALVLREAEASNVLLEPATPPKPVR